MTLVIVISAVVVAASVATIWLTVRYMGTGTSRLPDELVSHRDRLREALDRLILVVPDKPRLDSDEVPDHPRAASIEAKILAGDKHGALVEAENSMVDSPGDPRVHVLLARVLIHNDEIEPAWAEIQRARSLGAAGPMIDYLQGRAHHLRVLRATNPDSADVQSSPVPSLITPFEMFVLQLEGQRQRSQQAAALWLASIGDGKRTLSHEEISELVADHFRSYYDSLDKLLEAAEAAPGFTEALYHTARLALKVGFIRRGMALMNAIGPLMENSPEKHFYDRDMAELREEELPAVMNKLPPVPPTAKRSKSLKVLN